MPIYYITTRDSFAFDLIEKISYVNLNNRMVKKIEYLFDLNNLPSNFKFFLKDFPDGRTGCTSYHDFFSHEELLEIEDCCFQTEKKGI